MFPRNSIYMIRALRPDVVIPVAILLNRIIEGVDVASLEPTLASVAMEVGIGGTATPWIRIQSGAQFGAIQGWSHADVASITPVVIIAVAEELVFK